MTASTVNQVLSALRFFYKVTLSREWALDHLRYPRRAKRLPAVLSKAEVYRVFSVTRNPKHRTLLKKKFLSLLKEAHNNRKLSFHGELRPLANQGQWMRFLKPLYKKKWVVYVRPPFGGAEQVLKYLARYTHRVAISNQRLLSLEDGKVRFRWKDYRNGNRQRTMTLDAVEFLRRFLLHVFPKGFVHIRYYGFLANRNRKKKIALCRKLLGLPENPSLCLQETSGDEINEPEDQQSTMLCPVCKKGRMVEVQTARADPMEARRLLCFLVHDTR